MRRTYRSRLIGLLATILLVVPGATMADGSAQISPPVQPIDISHAVGQLLIGTYAGTTPSAAVLSAVQAGRLGGILLGSANTVAGVVQVQRAVTQLQAAAKRGGNPGLLVLTDQEGGEVRRLPVAPVPSAASMGADADPAAVNAQGRASAKGLRAAGVNVDLAPVADVGRAGGFIAEEQRSFGSDPTRVAQSACAFAKGLLAGGVAATLKHFPGLGDAVDSTDDGPVSVPTSAPRLEAEGAAYRACGSGPRTLVMISSASYPAVTGTRPAVLAPQTYQTLLPADGVDATTISDALDTPAFRRWPHPAQTALSAGLDLLLYAKSEANAPAEQQTLVAAVRAGHLSRTTLALADGQVAALKHALGLS